MERRAIAICGTVQGVGFRPFVFGLASRLRLGGFVRNSTSGVRIEVEGESVRLEEFLADLTTHPPPLARIDAVAWEPRPVRGETEFRIEQSLAEPPGAIAISPDVATCDDCLAELFDPNDRRYRYPFLNCTNCGPRLTIVTGAPYDRERTTMSSFTMCAECLWEYEDPRNRRFHAQPTACPACGPRLQACDAGGRALDLEDPLKWFADALRTGRIGAMKGLGGYHLVCDARNETAVAALRRRKHRDEKPFALMARNLEAAGLLCEINAAERELLASSRRPIVLLRRRTRASRPDDSDRQDGGVRELIAPANPMLGVMLPYTPLHHLLLCEMGDVPLVMTSGNQSDEPIAYEEPQAFERLRGIADAFLTHDRRIHVRCDDSVTRIVAGAEAPLRRSRGYAPHPIRLPVACPAPGLAAGGQLKATFALGRENQAILSHHLGDLDHFEAYRAFEQDVGLYEQLFELRPRWIAHDLHPDYASTRYAQRRHAQEGIPLIPVQHHHAHLAACMAEHGLTKPVIGVTFDGSGFGTDGTIWGGEFLIGDYCEFRRAAHLRCVRMPGSEKAVREPWRMAISHLLDSGAECPSLHRRIDPIAARATAHMLEGGFNSPLTSSAGRLFDAVASIAGIRDHVSFEGQAAMQLEWLATNVVTDSVYPVRVIGTEVSGPLQIDTRPLIQTIASDVRRETDPAVIARRFHHWFSEAVTQVCVELYRQTGISEVVLSGGVFMNALLSGETEENLRSHGFCPYRHRAVPANDGGLSLGQIAVAAGRLTRV